jgi:hypothetical protein
MPLPLDAPKSLPEDDVAGRLGALAVLRDLTAQGLL